MKPSPFTYHAPATIEEALAIKAELAGECRVLAGGQSLVPLMRFRLANPAHLLDINEIGGLDGIARTNGHVAIGALARYSDVMASSVVGSDTPLVTEAVGLVGHQQIRNRGTVCGSLAHHDPSAELPATLLAMGGEVVVRSPRGERVVAAADFLTGPFSTAVTDDEIVVEARFPVWPDGTGSSFTEMTRIYNGFPVAGAAALVHIADGVVQRVGLGMCGVGATALSSDAGQAMVGESPSSELITQVAETAAAALDPPPDVHGGREYRRGVARSCIRRALNTAVERAGGA